MRLLLLLFLLVSCFTSEAQSFFQITTDLGDDRAESLVTLPNGDFIVAGMGRAASTQTVPLLQRFDAQGQRLWAKTYTGLFSDPISADIELTAQGNLLLAFNQDVVDGLPSGWALLGADGQLQKVRLLGGGGSRLHHIARAADGQVMCGQVSFTAGDAAALVVKLDQNGNFQWSTALSDGGLLSLSGCQVDSLGFIYCAGTSTDFSGDTDGLLMKISPSGNLLWAKRIGSDSPDALTSVVLSGDSRLRWAGHSPGFGTGDTDLWVVETDRDGNLRWSRTYELGEDDLGATDLLRLPGDQFLIVANKPGDDLDNKSILLKINAVGDLLWANRYQTNGERDVLRRVRQTPDGNFLAVGRSARNGDIDTYLAKLQASDGLIPECCPKPVTLLPKDVTPELEPFVPSKLAALTNYEIFLQEDAAMPSLTSLCKPVNTDFTFTDTLVCPGECTMIDFPNPSDGVTYSWTFQGGLPAQSSQLHPGQVCFPGAGTAKVTLNWQRGVCSGAALENLEVGTHPAQYFNAFTPDGDGTNDTFHPLLPCPVENYLLHIYDRWGQIIFEGIYPSETWDGSVNLGAPAPSDLYLWQVEYELGDGEVQRAHGEVHLLR